MRRTEDSPTVAAGNTLLRHLASVGATVVLISLLGAGCGGSHPMGSARIEAWATNGANIARVTVTVRKGGGSDFDPITTNLEKNGVEWWGHFEQVPTGKRRQFDIVAYGSDDAVLCSVTTWSDINRGVETFISVLLQLQVPLPIIDAVTASRCEVAPRGAVQVAGTAHDPGGGPVTYHWSATCGSFDDPSKAATTWTAPDTRGTCRLSITVANSVGVSVTASLDVAVKASPGRVDVEVRVDTWPVIATFTASVTLGATLEGDIHVEASDVDGDALTYVWTSTCPGVAFNVEAPYGAASPHFSLPGPSDECAILLMVADPAGGQTPATLILPPNKGIGGT